MVLCLAASTAACATHDAKPDKIADAAPVTPTERYTIQVAPGVDEILLAPHADGLSARQAAALDNLVDRWRDAGGGEITIQRAPGADEVFARAVDAVATRLTLLGVDSDQVRLVRYTQGARPGDPMVVGFVRDKAQGPQCGRKWKSMTSTASNDVNSNFGCAITANMAAMIDNPDDLVAPRPMQPVDAERRLVVIENYRKGVVTSSAKDGQATGTVSSAVQ
jgi:pilus assembly protein CpaD